MNEEQATLAIIASRIAAAFARDVSATQPGDRAGVERNNIAIADRALDIAELIIAGAKERRATPATPEFVDALVDEFHARANEFVDYSKEHGADADEGIRYSSILRQIANAIANARRRAAGTE